MGLSIQAVRCHHGHRKPATRYFCLSFPCFPQYFSLIMNFTTYHHSPPVFLSPPVHTVFSPIEPPGAAVRPEGPNNLFSLLYYSYRKRGDLVEKNILHLEPDFCYQIGRNSVLSSCLNEHSVSLYLS